jgi:3-phenylpropionate/trans-cinnamate dioxygenase ferredoxin reductase subunit
MHDTIVMIGGGQASIQTADQLRRGGFAGRLVIIGDEPHPGYQRPPLSKKFLAGELAAERLWLKTPAFYDSAHIELKLGVRAEALRRDTRQVVLSNGEDIHYDYLLLATGATPRQALVPGHELAGVHTLRSIADVDRIRASLATGRRVVIVGGGYIGLEVAATCRNLGCEVDVLEMTDRVMNRVVAPEVSEFFAAEHRARGVRIHTNTTVSGFSGSATEPARVASVHTLNGEQFAADVVIVGIGVTPNIGLAVAAGLACENGIAVDEWGRTSDPRIYAAGDCCSHPSPRYGRRIRLESVDNAFEQSKTIAANLLGGQVQHDKIPWFWSDQYDLKLLIVGLNFDYDQVIVRGSPSTRSFSCCYLKHGELLAIDCVNNSKDYLAAKALIAKRSRCHAPLLADPTIALKDTLEASQSA